MYRILLVEDSRWLAERVKEVLEETSDVSVVATVDTESAAVEYVRSSTVDLLVLDLKLREGTGFGVLEKLGTKAPPSIILTNYALPAYGVKARQLGVLHFLDKSRDSERLPEIVRTLRNDHVS
jgi:DNA-binding NarL/FixJ family response regulator